MKLLPSGERGGRKQGRDGQVQTESAMPGQWNLPSRRSQYSKPSLNMVERFCDFKGKEATKPVTPQAN